VAGRASFISGGRNEWKRQILPSPDRKKIHQSPGIEKSPVRAKIIWSKMKSFFVILSCVFVSSSSPLFEKRVFTSFLIFYCETFYVSLYT
jgi:hypothetical protein